MKKTVWLIILVFIFISSISAENIKITTDKQNYRRYEIIDIFCDFQIPKKKKILFQKMPNETSLKEASVCTAKIFRGRRQITTVGNISILELEYNPALDKWIGKWPLPWNARPGKYRALVTLKIDKKKFAGNASFTVKARKPKPLPNGFCAMNIEPGDSIIKRVPGVGGKSVKVWENYILWSKFMGASALWHNVGQSQIWNKLDESVFPWDKMVLRQVSQVGEACHKYDMLYGTWITSYVQLGNRLDLSPYRRTTGYDRSNDSLRTLKYISIYDQKRQQDIVDLLKKLQADPNVDHLGLDYMRTDFGGYEYAKSFVEEMPVRDLPDDWNYLEADDQMLWLARKLEVEKDKDMADMWNWWRAHKMSMIIHEIIIKSGLKKPLWVFSLTWRQGKEHGQDPLMFIDAGVDFNSAMFYSIGKSTYPMMIDDWRDYLRRGNTNLVAGQCVDWNLLGRTYDPTGPQEHYDRQRMAIDRFYPVNPTLGLFWHDLTRAFMNKARGPYSPLEWAVAGAASFSYLREKQGYFPFEVTWDAPDKVSLGEPFTVEINVKNTSQVTMNYYLKLLKVKNLSMYGDVAQKFYLTPGEIKTMTFQVRVMNREAKKKYMQLLSFMIQYNGLKTQQRYFDFKYLKVNKNVQ